jgi:hypothetical protein
MEAQIYSANGTMVYEIKRDNGTSNKVIVGNGQRRLSGSGLVKTVYGAKFKKRIDGVIEEVKEALK